MAAFVAIATYLVPTHEVVLVSCLLDLALPFLVTAIIGKLYMAVVVARLIGLHILARRHQQS